MLPVDENHINAATWWENFVLSRWLLQEEMKYMFLMSKKIFPAKKPNKM